MFFKRLMDRYRLWILMVIALTGIVFMLAASAISLKPIFYAPGPYWLH